MPNLVEHANLLCDRYYELKTPQIPSRIQPGQLVTAHATYPNDPPWIAEVTGVNSKMVSYEIKRFDPQSPAKTRFPIKEMNLGAEENLYILKGKIRPAIALQTVATDFYNRAYPEMYTSILPCYTFKDKHDQKYRARIAAFESKNLFYLPYAHEGLEAESVLRFEHVQPVPLSCVRPILIDGKHSLLSETVWAILLHRYSLFLSGKGLDNAIEESIECYRALITEAYNL